MMKFKMANEDKLKLEELKRRLGDDLEFRLSPAKIQAKALGCSEKQISYWKEKKVPKEMWQKWLEESRMCYAPKSMEVDEALFKQAKKGNVKAIELWYQKQEAWSIKQVIENINKTDGLKDLTDVELKALVLKDLPEDKVDAILRERKIDIRVESPGGITKAAG